MVEARASGGLGTGCERGGARLRPPALRACTSAGRPFGSEDFVSEMAEDLGVAAKRGPNGDRRDVSSWKSRAPSGTLCLVACLAPMIAVDTPHHVMHTPPRSTSSIQLLGQEPPETCRLASVSPGFLCRESEGFAQARARLIESLPSTTAISSAVRPYSSYTSRSISASVASI